MHKRTFLFTLATLATQPVLALYDPKPNGLLEGATGSWKGTLTYRDYQNPDKMVVLPTRLAVSMTSPDELALYYVFDDGPGKIVYSYERMRFDVPNAELIWVSGSAKPTSRSYRISSATTVDRTTKIAFEKSSDSGVDRYLFEISPRAWMLSKTEIKSSGGEALRSRYELVKNNA
jgi:hypothetical protein